MITSEGSRIQVVLALGYLVKITAFQIGVAHSESVQSGFVSSGMGEVHMMMPEAAMKLL